MEMGGITITGSSQWILVGGAFLVGAVIATLVTRVVVRKRTEGKLTGTKDQFVSLASHYLLTPISIIQGSLASLQEKDSVLKVEERQKLYDSIYKGQQRLWILAEQFLLVSQVEKGMLKLNLETGSMSDVVQSSMAAVDIFAREKGIKMEFQDKTQAIQECRFDQRRFKQAVVAILDNAIKFSPDGASVTVALNQEPHGFSVDVSDQGAGMTQDAIRTATQSFARGTSSLTFDHEGIGLGLYIASAIVYEHGGELRFETRKQQGTTVTLRFPNQ